MVEGTSALSESVALRGEAPEGKPRLACSSRRSYSKSRRESHARDPGVRRPPRRGTSVGHHHVMATCVSTFSAHTSTVTGPSLGPPTCASCAGHLPGRTCCIARVKSSVAHVGGIGKPVMPRCGAGGENVGGVASFEGASPARTGELSRKGGPPCEEKWVAALVSQGYESSIGSCP